MIKSELDKIALQNDINSCVNWATTWKTSFNSSKCKVMLFNKPKDELNTAFVTNTECPTPDYTMCDNHGFNQTLEVTPIERDLGILLNNKLDWSDQI